MQISLSVAAVLSLAVFTQAWPTARLGRFCCPKASLSGVALTKQDVGPFAVVCSYGETVCKYSVSTGYSRETEDCPVTAVANANAPTCS